MIRRSIKLPKTNSFFLFGPRGSGKTTLLWERYSQNKTLFFDLLDIQLLDELLLDPSRFQKTIDLPENKNKPVIIDEVQKLPQLLDLVHQQIQRHKRQFILTGSSARKLKQKGVNLLAGRAWTLNLYPLTSWELASEFDLKRALELGTLPEAYLSASYEDAREYLTAYVGTYLEKEIQQERWVRKIIPFRRFLAIAAQTSGQVVNYSQISRDVGVDDVTVASYFEILEDTLLGFYLPAFHRSVRKAQKQTPKFYLIDTGIKRALQKTLSVELLPQTYAWGDAFENWIILELYKNASYLRYDWSFSYLKTKDGYEIDLIIERPGQPLALIEIKSKAKVSASDAKALEALGPDIDKKAQHFLLSCDELSQKFGKTNAFHWQKGLCEILGVKK